MKQHLKKFSSETEYNAYINGNPVLPNVSLIGDSGKVKFITEDYYINQYLTFEILEDGYIGFNDTYDTGQITIQYNKNNTGWTNLTFSRCDLLATEITVEGKSGIYTYGGYDNNQYSFYWVNGNDKVYAHEYSIPDNLVNDVDSNQYQVLTAKREPVPITTEITVDGKNGIYTYGGADFQHGGFYWFNGNDKLMNQACYLYNTDFVFDTGADEYQILTIKNEPNNNFMTVTEGDVLQFRGDNQTYYDESEEIPVSANFVLTGKFNIYGNIMSLINSTEFTTAKTLTKPYTFGSIFAVIGVVDAKNLVLPATTLTSGCYDSMFLGCSSLTAAPKLPAMTMAENCYSNMFNGCSSLTAAPKLPSTTLAAGCYQNMFTDCTSLTAAPELPATTLTASCYSNMFNGCTSLTAAPELPATTLTASCYSNMFYGCTSLTTVPALSAMTIAENCYSYMFKGCTSLTVAPALPSTTLAESCYECMFCGCTSLTTAPELPATVLETSCYSYMFNGCASLNYIKCLATKISAQYCTYNWVNGVSSTGTFVKNASMNHWTTGNNGIPSGWTVQDAS